MIADSVKTHYNKIISQIYDNVLDKFNILAKTEITGQKFFKLCPECREEFLKEIEHIQKVMDDHNIEFEGRDSFRARQGGMHAK